MGAVRDLWDAGDPQLPAGFAAWGEKASDEADAAVPVGGIILWSGSIATIPSNFALCNGQNGTPDLRDRFVVGAGNQYDPDDVGGVAAVTLTTAQIPGHTHASGSLSTGNAGGHDHRVRVSRHGSGSAVVDHGHNSSARAAGSMTGLDNITTHWTDPDGTDAVSNHTHGVSGSTGSTGSGNSHENRPPYYALAYIMRIS